MMRRYPEPIGPDTIFDAGSNKIFSQEAWETLFEFSYDGIYITDGNAITIMVNKSYETITGLQRKDMLGRSMYELVEKRVISQSGTLAALARGESVTLEQIFQTGKRATITSTPIFDQAGEAVMVVTNVRDITELHSLQCALEKSRSCNQQYFFELESLRRQIGRAARFIAEDPAMKEVLRIADKVAALDIPILLEGELGSGKQELARYIVSKSRRKKARFAEVNCSSYTPEELEQELFGCGGANRELRKGILELLDGGTVLLHEVCSLSLDTQARLVEFLQTHTLKRVGDTVPIRSDVRMLISTRLDLKELVRENRFREDLYFLLNVMSIRTLPLRRRREDILPLVDELSIYLNKKYHQRTRFTEQARHVLKCYDWPGNLRELRNVVESALILCSNGIVDAADLPIQPKVCPVPTPEPSAGQLDLRSLVEDLERKYISSAYARYGNIRDAARSLNMDPTTFARKRRKLCQSGYPD